MNDGQPVTQAEGHLRFAYLILAWVALGLALLGMVLPLMPGTLFLLIAVWAAARGSTRLHDWIHAQPRLASLIADWREQGAIPRHAKWLATVMMAGSWGYLVWAGHDWYLLAGMAMLLGSVALFLWTRPDPLAREPVTEPVDSRPSQKR